MIPNLPDQDIFLDQTADAICRRGLRLPALIALEAGRPLTFLVGQLLWMAKPALSLFLPSQTIRYTAQLLEEPDAVDALVTRLEAQEA